MADCAYLYKSGVKTLVRASDLTDDYRGYEFTCCGPEIEGRSGNRCGAKMIVVRGNSGKFHFRVAPDDKHIPGCFYDEAPEMIVVKSLDRTGRNITPELLFHRIMGLSPSHSKKQTPKGDPSEEIKSITNINIDEDDRIINRGKRDPRTLEELYKLLYVLLESGVSCYSGMPISNLIIDRTSCSSFKDGVPEDNPCIIVAEKQRSENMPTKIRELSGYLKFPFTADDKSHELRRYVVVPNTKEIWNIIRSNEKTIAFLGFWQQVASMPDVYRPNLEFFFPRKAIYMVPEKMAH